MRAMMPNPNAKPKILLMKLHVKMLIHHTNLANIADFGAKKDNILVGKLVYHVSIKFSTRIRNEKMDEWAKCRNFC